MSTPKPGRHSANAARLQAENAKRSKQKYGQQSRLYTGKRKAPAPTPRGDKAGSGKPDMIETL